MAFAACMSISYNYLSPILHCSENMLLEKFKEMLAKFSNQIDPLQQCMNNCCVHLRDCLSELDCDLGENSQHTLQIILNDFQRALDETPYLIKNDKTILHTEFRKALASVVMQKWSQGMGVSFVPISTVTSEKLRIQKAMEWTQRFFNGITYFQHLDESINRLKLETLILSAFESAIHISKLQKIERIQKRLERDATTITKQERNELYAGLMSSELSYDSEIEFGKRLIHHCFEIGSSLEKQIKPKLDCELFQRAFFTPLKRKRKKDS